MHTEHEDRYMRLALEWARSARGQTSPNPLVGAVIVNKGQIVGMGVHLGAGLKHAEVHALEMAGQAAQGATLYVRSNHVTITGGRRPVQRRLSVQGSTGW